MDMSKTRSVKGGITKPTTSTTKRFREAKSKRWCFTLNNPQLGEGVDTDLVTYMIVGDETGDEGTRHFQGYAEFKTEQRLGALKKLLPRAHWEKSKGNPWSNFLYCSKDGNFMEHGDRPKEPRASTRKSKADAENEDYSEALLQPTVREGIDVVKRKRPRDYCLHGESIERNLKKSKIQHHQSLYKIDQFSHEPMQLDKPVLLWGGSGFGKTQFAISHFTNPLLVRHIDKLKTLNPDHDGIVFDDMAFKHWPREAIIHLLDQEVESEINVRYGTVTIPANTKKIFTHNTSNPFYIEEDMDVDQKAAIERRFQRVHVNNKLFK